MDFTVVTAVYNTSLYLDEYFESLLVRQDYEGGMVKIIAVDDGSTDDSLEKIRFWERKFPQRVKCLSKENGGQASARNLGMRYVDTEWVTFIDSDDFVSDTYFSNVAASISEHPNAILICCNNIRYNESNDTFTNSHFLKYRFAKGNKFFDLFDDDLYPQHSASLAFFKSSLIRLNEINFPERLRISFEDALFVGNYLMKCAEGEIGFLADAKYYARQRANGSSTTDGSFANPSYFNECLELGHLTLLRSYIESWGYAPAFIQKTVLYDLVWRIKWHIDGSPQVPCLSNDENIQYKALLFEIFNYIDIETIQKAPSRLFWYFHKAAIASYFKKTSVVPGYVYIERLDINSQSIVFRCFGDGVRFFLNGEMVLPEEESNIDHQMLGDHLITERYLRFSYHKLKDIFSAKDSSGNKMEIKFKKKKYTGKTILFFASATQKKRLRYIQHGNVWLISDSIEKADDNGEHFYRYMMNHHPDQRAYYVLSRSSEAWNRLEKEGFKLVEFGTKKYEKVLRSASVLISSQILDGMTNYFRDQYRWSKKFVFLQHGVIKDDLSSWLNKNWIDLLITSSKREYDSIVSEGGRYRIFPSQVALTGLARFDHLLALNKSIATEKILLVAPTWRKALSGGLVGGTGERLINPDFSESEFCKMWEQFFASEGLRDLCRKRGYRVLFAPHPNLDKYVRLGYMRVPDYIDIKPSELSWQVAFARAELLITDYSSNAFEMAYLEKPTFYYQFDRDFFFGGGHTYSKGYFSYENDGFGPVSSTHAELLSGLEKYFENGRHIESHYARNIKSCFYNRDGRCCERIYDAIQRLVG